MKRSDHPHLFNTIVTQAALCGGTHGNERTGVAAIQRRRLPSATAAAGLPAPAWPETYTLTPLVGNPKAVELNRRYVDFDLNRCFSAADLTDHHGVGYERQRAQVLNRLLGPKGSPDPAYQFLIDLHTTTAALGPTVIIREDEPLARVVAATVQQDLPEVRIMSYIAEADTGHDGDEETTATSGPAVSAGGGPASANRPGDYPYVAEITPHGIEIEVGPVPQGVVRADVLTWTEKIINAVVAALDRWNRDEEMGCGEEMTVFRYIGDDDYPRDADGTALGMIHPERQDADFRPLHNGDPLFLTFDGTVVSYTGPDGAVPVFVNEAAYYEKRAAFTLAMERTIPVIPA